MKSLTSKIKKDLTRAQGYRARWQWYQKMAHKTHISIIKELHNRGWSFREMAPTLGISAQRIGQLYKQIKN